MIASVAGQVTSIGPDCAVVEVGGFGLAVQCTPTTLASLRVGASTRLATSLIVREDSLTLYGFPDDAERSLFELLQTVSGVGPRVAQAVLSIHLPEVVRGAIASGDVSTLTRVPGIGKKGAERIILELRDKIGPVAPGAVSTGVPRQMAWQDQVRQGLVGLGWTAGQADQAITVVAEGIDGPTPPVPELLKQAIKLLGRAR